MRPPLPASVLRPSVTLAAILLLSGCPFDFHGDHMCYAWEATPSHGLALSHSQPQWCPVDVETHGTYMSGGGSIAYNASEQSYTFGVLKIFVGQSSYEIASSMDYFDPNPYDPGYNGHPST